MTIFLLPLINHSHFVCFVHITKSVLYGDLHNLSDISDGKMKFRGALSFSVK